MFRLARGLNPSSYRREWLSKDVVAGIVLSTLLVPQGMAYAELAGLPPITGLYTSILCLLGYAVLGSSRILVLGPDSSLGPMIAATILLGPLFAGALGIALVSLADTISTSSAFAARTGQEINGNGEMIGIGAANLAAGLFQGFPVSTSGSRTAVAERSGAKSQLTGIIGAAVIIVMIVLVPGLFRNLPQPALAAVVITASLSLADIPGTARLWRQRKAECLLSIAAFLGVVLLGVLPGIAIAVGLSVLNVFRRAWWPYDTELGRVEGLAGYHDVHSYPEAGHLPGLVIYRFDGPLFFANTTTFRDEIRRMARADPPPRWILVAAEPITDVDTTASDMLEELDETLNAQHTSLVFAELKDPVRRKIECYGLTRTIDPHHFYPTIESAVAAFREETGADWTAATTVDGQATPTSGDKAITGTAENPDGGEARDQRARPRSHRIRASDRVRREQRGPGGRGGRRAGDRRGVRRVRGSAGGPHRPDGVLVLRGQHRGVRPSAAVSRPWFVTAAVNAIIRILFAMGRERVLPQSLSRRHTPVMAIGCVAALALMLGLPLTYIFGGARIRLSRPGAPGFRWCSSTSP
jgi:hypothetical protein